MLWIKRLGVVFMNSKTCMVVMELVSQHLDESKINGLISKLHEFLSWQIWVCCLAWFFNKSWVDALTQKFLWCILDIQGSSSVKFHDNWTRVEWRKTQEHQKLRYLKKIYVQIPLLQIWKNTNWCRWLRTQITYTHK